MKKSRCHTILLNCKWHLFFAIFFCTSIPLTFAQSRATIKTPGIRSHQLFHKEPTNAISGIVHSLTGAKVCIVGTSYCVFTDTTGFFLLNFPSLLCRDSLMILEISRAGFSTNTIRINPASTQNIESGLRTNINIIYYQPLLDTFMKDNVTIESKDKRCCFCNVTKAKLIYFHNYDPDKTIFLSNQIEKIPY